MPNKYQLLFGSGPLGMVLTLVLLGVAWLADRWVGHPTVLGNQTTAAWLGAILAGTGLVWIAWSLITLRPSARGKGLVTTGPNRWVRHPYYAGWITLVCPGVALCLNSWIYVLWAILIHPLWHLAISSEERFLVQQFGREYEQYAAGKGRFLPFRLRAGCTAGGCGMDRE